MSDGHIELNYEDTISSGGSVQDAVDELISSYNQAKRMWGMQISAADVPLASMTTAQQDQLAAVVPRALWRECNYKHFGQVNRGQVTNTIHLVNTAPEGQRVTFTQIMQPRP